MLTSIRSILLVCASVALILPAGGCQREAPASNPAPVSPAANPAAAAPKSLSLSAEQRNAIRVEPANTSTFVAETETVGTVTFDEDPAIVQAESTLISAAATLEMSRKALVRVEALGEANGIAPKELEGDVAARDTAAAALKAARDAVRALGKTDAEIDRMVATGHFDTPAAAPRTTWVLLNVPETDSARVHLGQKVRVQVPAYPDRWYAGRLSRIYSTVDPNTHRLTARARVEDQRSELRAGMLAAVLIRSGEPVESVALPTAAVVREGDGSMITWVTTDREHFAERPLTLGLEREGHYQVLAGLKANELVVVQGGVFLSNLLEAPPSD
jgi:membrane fusion protein, heavy metal efflux system